MIPMKTFFALISIAMIHHSALSQNEQAQELKAVPSVDLHKYAGTWYEIARYPNRFQNDCAGDVTATYTIDEDGIEVVNRCRKQSGEVTEAKGRARLASEDGPNSKLKVRFAPAFLSIFSFVWGNYWIIDLAPDYSYAVIGEPERKYLWILSRTKKLDDVVFAKILERIKLNGYDTTKLVITPQM
jgi:apolipoprotein D and lipocalin family protein